MTDFDLFCMYVFMTGTGEQVDVMCGASECETEGAENRACEPILVLRGDRDFTNKTCLMFVRTQEVMRDNCELGNNGL